MTYHSLFHIKDSSTVEEALFELSMWLSDIYEVDDPESGKILIGGYSENQILHQKFKHAILEKSSLLEEINWQEQWANFAPSFYDGVAHIDLKSLGGPVLLLSPGAGFGDLSHPTTRLVMTLMAPFIKDKIVFDIGCGSGILSVAAVLLGAKKVYGIDIEERAIKHSQENAKLNQVEGKVKFFKKIIPSWIPNELFIVVMNMIESEQQAAWKSLTPLHSKKALIIVSGILSVQKGSYLECVKSRGWSLQEEIREDEWLAFVFKQT